MAHERKKKEVALLYARVSTSAQATDGMSLGAQERDLRRAATAAGYAKVELLREEGRSGKSIKGRPVLRGALDRLDKGSAHAIYVTRVDRLARSTQDFLSIIDRANKNNWRLVMLDLNLDTATYQGRFVVTIMSALAEMERAIIAERQKDVHKDRRIKGEIWGVDLGPKSKVDTELLDSIVLLRTGGLSLGKIANYLNDAKVPTTNKGKRWYGSSVSHVLAMAEKNKQRRPDKEKQPEP